MATMNHPSCLLHAVRLALIGLTALTFACDGEPEKDATESVAEPVPAVSAAPSAAPSAEPAEGAREAEVEPSSAGSAGTNVDEARSAPTAEASETATAKPNTPTAASTPTPTPAKYSGDKPCLQKTFKFSSVRQACERGGIPEAKALMQAAVKKAKAKGETIKCKSCHSDLKTYEQKDNAALDLKKWL
jgi:hypothetical protein